jgi:hypothetical protein
MFGDRLPILGHSDRQQDGNRRPMSPDATMRSAVTTRPTGRGQARAPVE